MALGLEAATGRIGTSSSVPETSAVPDGTLLDQERTRGPVVHNEVDGRPRGRPFTPQQKAQMPSLHGRYQEVRFGGIFGYRLHQHQSRLLVGMLGQEFDGVANDHGANRFRQSNRRRIAWSQSHDVNLLIHGSLTHDRFDLRLRQGQRRTCEKYNGFHLVSTPSRSNVSQRFRRYRYATRVT